MKSDNKQNRRQFIKRLALMSGGATLMATQGRFQLINSALAASSDYANLSDYKSLICIYLYGGNDGFNMMVPTDQGEYNYYTDQRRHLAIPKSQLISLSKTNQGFHPSLAGLANLYNRGNLAVVGNVGALVEPTTRITYQSGEARLPFRLFAHDHQTDFWQTLKKNNGGLPPTGWGGRMMDLLHSSTPSPSTPTSFSMGGGAKWLIADNTKAFSLSKGGVRTIDYLEGKRYLDKAQAMERIQSLGYHESILKRQMADTFSSGYERVKVLSQALQDNSDVSLEDDSSEAQSLTTIVRAIKAREEFGMHRQVFFMGIGGWDTHNDQLARHAALLSALNNLLVGLHDALEGEGLLDTVTTFTASDFGRTYTVNSSGTDHAWSSHALVMGGAVNGKKVYGKMPNFIVGGPDDASSTGRFIPNISVDQYTATLAKWMGVSENDCLEIFPHLRNFDSKDIGFMKS